MKIQEKKYFFFFFFFFFWGGGGRVGVRGQGGWERRIEVFVKIKKIGGGRVGGVMLRGGGCQGGCERRIEVFVQCTKRYCTILRKLKYVWGQYLNPLSMY